MNNLRKKRIFKNSEPFSHQKEPIRIEKHNHAISKNKISQHAIKVCEILYEHGYEAYIVGGAIRDLIIGLEPKDFDVVTNAKPKQIKNIFKRSRIIGRRFQLVHAFFSKEIIEISTFRGGSTEHSNADENGRILFDNFFGSRAEDSERRDFTINALYYDPKTEEILDYHQGMIDLRNRCIRTIGNPNRRYREDPVRILRAIRFSAKLNGTIDQQNCLPIGVLLKLIKNVPESRVFCEILKLLTCGNAVDCFRKLHNAGVYNDDTFPILDTILDEFSEKSFTELALKNTDERARSGKTISFSFLFAALFWKHVRARWYELYAKGEHSHTAINQAIKSVLDEQKDKLFINRRFFSGMREIWFIQTRFNQKIGKFAYRIFEHPQFRAACDFLQLRAAFGEFDINLAKWWLEFSNKDKNSKIQMLRNLTTKSENR